MAIHDNDFLAAVACHLVGSFLQERELQIGAERKMWSVFFQDAKREQARPLRAVNAFAEVRGREFFSMDRQRRL
jgi:hypothetical protein